MRNIQIHPQRRYAAHGWDDACQPCAVAHGYKRTGATRLKARISIEFTNRIKCVS
jgi:hypothetical protein